MKKNYLPIITFFSLFLILFSCESDSDSEDSGLIDKRDALAGAWNCLETGDLGEITYELVIWKDKNSLDSMVIENLHNSNKQLFVAYRNDSIIINKQKFDGDTIHGKGYVRENKRAIDLIYYIDEGNGDEKVIAEITQKPI